MHRAGADFVISFASLGANTVFNMLQRSDILMIGEGLDIIRMKVPRPLIGKTIAESQIRRLTGCSIISAEHEGVTVINPEPHTVLEDGEEIVLIGTAEAENRFFKVFT